jgi:GxxExxY protein
VVVDKLLYKDLSYLVVGAAIEVHKILGPGFLENVYEQALAHEFTLRGIQYVRQALMEVRYKEIRVGKYWADFVIDGKIILEIKATAAFAPGHEAQVLHYLAATRLRLALLLNFGTESLQVKRIIR